MTHTFKLSVVASALVILSACGQQEVNQEPKPVELTNEQQEQAYAFGGNLASFTKSRLSEYTELGLELDTALIVQGFKDTLAEKSVVDEAKFSDIVRNIDRSVSAKRQELADQKAEENKIAGAEFLKTNGEREGVVTTESGLQYEVIEAADGAKPKATDTVKVHYTGTLLDGTKFDSSVDRGEPAVFPLNRVIKGWTEGLQYMSVGSKYKFYIPADLAYGNRSTGSITPGSTLVFDVELIEIPSQN